MNPASSASLGRLPSQALDALSNASCSVSPRVAFVLRGSLHVAGPPSLAPLPSRRAYFLLIRHQPSRVAQALQSFWFLRSPGPRGRCQPRKAERSGGGWRSAPPCCAGRSEHEALCHSAAWPPPECIEPCVGLAVSVRSQPMQEARAQFHSPSVLVQRRSRPRPNPSFERTRSGMSALAFISFSAKPALPPRAAQLKR